jgi:hypothetical protein
VAGELNQIYTAISAHKGKAKEGGLERFEDAIKRFVDAGY